VGCTLATFVLSDIISSEEETTENKGDKFAQSDILMMYYKSFLCVSFNYYGNNCVCHLISHYAFYSIHHLQWRLLDINVTVTLISSNVSEILRSEYLDEQMKESFS